MYCNNVDHSVVSQSYKHSGTSQNTKICHKVSHSAHSQSFVYCKTYLVSDVTSTVNINNAINNKYTYQLNKSSVTLPSYIHNKNQVQ